MLTTLNFIQYLSTLFPDVTFYNSAINKASSQCIGVYNRGGFGQANLAIGGKLNTSLAQLPITLLIHWTEDADQCEQRANTIYDTLLGSHDLIMNNVRVISLDMIDGNPIGVSRDSNNIVEMVIRLIINYER